MSRDELLSVVSAWLDATTEGPNGDQCLVIEKVGYLREPNSATIQGVQFVVKTHTVVASAHLPVNRIVKPEAPSILTP